MKIPVNEVSQLVLILLSHLLQQNPIRTNGLLHDLLLFISRGAFRNLNQPVVLSLAHFPHLWIDPVLHQDSVSLPGLFGCKFLAVARSLIYVVCWIDSSPVGFSRTCFVMGFDDTCSTINAGSMIGDRPLTSHWVTPPSTRAQPGVSIRILVPHFESNAVPSTWTCIWLITPRAYWLVT